ncbi:MAG: methionine--tRNA ligase [Rickettsiales bacterium]|jgi:methionyl-tRNA synthetase|nr:methionine--tRNA ligase [Rickettsiales bacterium]
MKKKFFVTTPIYYVNSEPHIGSAYTTIMADIVNRFKKLSGCDTFFLTGTDEHGMKIQQSAHRSGKNEQEFVDEIAKIFRDSADFMGCGYDDFIRTTEKRHRIFVQNIWKILMENGWLYRGKYEGWYCVGDEAYYGDNELVKNKDGEYTTELGKSVEWKEEDSYFFRLGEFQKMLLDIYANNKKFIQPESRRNEIISFVGGGNLKDILAGNFKKDCLKDLSVSRNNFSWGIKIPWDDRRRQLIDENDDWLDGIDDGEKHVAYVWLDALFNYQSALGDRLGYFWGKEGETAHIVGKDIVKFHAIYWPAFLMAVKYSREEFKNITCDDILKSGALPDVIFAHGWWTNEGKKISKSFGNAVNPREEIKWLQEKFGITKDVALDYLRYYLSTEGIFGNDLDYSRLRLVEKINAELANNLGNLMQRVLSMIYRELGGEIGDVDPAELDDLDRKNLNSAPDLQSLIQNETLHKFDFIGYRDLILTLANAANDYMEKTAPWNLKGDGDRKKLRKILLTQVRVLLRIAILLQPICPHLAGKALDFLGVNDRNFDSLGQSMGLIGRAIGEPKGFFPRLA